MLESFKDKHNVFDVVLDLVEYLECVKRNSVYSPIKTRIGVSWIITKSIGFYLTFPKIFEYSRL